MNPVTLYETNRAFGLRDLVDRRIAKSLGARSASLLGLRGHQMAVFANDLIGIQINLHGIYEREELEFLFGFLRPVHHLMAEGLALDIGANIGNHTLFFSDRFAAVHTFEPNPPTLALLRFNTRHAANTTIHGHGLGDLQGHFELVEDGVNVGGSSLAVQANQGQRTVSVPVERLDDLPLDLRKLCFIKLDVEGFEMQVLRGGERTLRSHQPLIVLEQHRKEFSAGSTDSIRLLKSLGYRFCWHERGGPAGGRWRHWWRAGRAMVFGEQHRMVSSALVPPGYYPMLLAVPPRFAAALKL